MLTLEDLTKRYGLSDRALRRRLDALGTAIEPYIRRGPNNALLFQDGALALLDRLAQLQREAGLGLADAAAQVKNEVLNGRAAPAGERPQSQSAGPGAEPGPNPEFQKLLESYEARIEEQARMISYLQAKLDEALARIPELPPAPPADRVRNVSRWQALKYALLGRP
jgi:DNA-binding transcriptional MerR regulator